jgi:hypothetical protein
MGGFVEVSHGVIQIDESRTMYSEEQKADCIAIFILRGAISDKRIYVNIGSINQQFKINQILKRYDHSVLERIAKTNNKTSYSFEEIMNLTNDHFFSIKN